MKPLAWLNDAPFTNTCSCLLVKKCLIQARVYSSRTTDLVLCLDNEAKLMMP